ncbi:CLUMA_CG004244, isoform A [Clunio marinus]|uniref:CLUMA_CG004244, isoform A n=1 Tax=Clunio marinus TaxID=568069 RepID=A0A1J1HT31_9DIPT|nr:CLUMA_CG004244, isoform A [Clunio marinus]
MEPVWCFMRPPRTIQMLVKLKGMGQLSVITLVLCIVNVSLSKPYANDYPYQKYGYNHESSAGDNDEARYIKSKLYDEGGRLKANSDTGLTYHLDSNTNKHNLHQLKRGSSTDNLKHEQGENFETDKSHKRKHVKSGFQNSYHKDENGSRSSYYEDSDDTGGKTVYDKKHGTRGDQQDSEYNEGLKNGVSRDKYDDRRTGFKNRDLADRQQSYIEDQGKQHGYNDIYKHGVDDRFQIIRRPYSDYRRLPLRDIDDGYDRYNAKDHWGYNNRLPPPPPLNDHLREPITSPSRDFANRDYPIRDSPIRDLPIRDLPARDFPNRDFQTRRRITIFEDPRDELIDPKVDRLHDNGNFMTRSEVTRRFDYGPSLDRDRTPMRLRYRGL